MKKLLYTEGPHRVNMGAAGQFVRGQAKQVEDDKLAEVLLTKKTILFYEEGKVPAAAQRRMKNLETAESNAKQPKQKEG